MLFLICILDRREDGGLGSMVSAVGSMIPMGLFLAAIFPNIVSVVGRRKRSADGSSTSAGSDSAALDGLTFPILDMISSFGVRSLQQPECQSKIVCEIGRQGGLPNANNIQRALWTIANYTPERLSRMVGADEVFRSIRNLQCAEFACASD